MQEYIVSKITGREILQEDQTESERDLENFCRTDQVLHFLEYEIEGLAKFVPGVLKETGIQDSPHLDSLRYASCMHYWFNPIPNRSQYIACLINLNTADSTLSLSVDDYNLLRKEYIAGGRRSSGDLARRIAQTKSSLSVQLSYRESLVKEKNAVLGTLRSIITRVQLNKLQESHLNHCSHNQWRNESTSSSSGDYTVTPLRRRPIQYSTDEIRAIINSLL